jgi:hypothetical protein
VDPVPDPLLFFRVVPGIEPGPPDLWPRTLTTRPQRRSDYVEIIFTLTLLWNVPLKYDSETDTKQFIFKIYRVITMAFICHNYHASGRHSSTYLYFKTRHLGNWILFPPSGGTYSEEPNRKRCSQTPDISN